MSISTSSDFVFDSVSHPLRSCTGLPIRLATCTHSTGNADAACDAAPNQGKWLGHRVCGLYGPVISKNARNEFIIGGEVG